jgi:hypothetical protein
MAIYYAALRPALLMGSGEICLIGCQPIFETMMEVCLNDSLSAYRALHCQICRVRSRSCMGYFPRISKKVMGRTGNISTWTISAVTIFK